MNRHIVQLLGAVSPKNTGGFPSGVFALMAFMTIAAAATTVQFKPVQRYLVGKNPSVAVGDLNGDGKPDVAVLSGTGSPQQVYILMRNGNSATGRSNQRACPLASIPTRTFWAAAARAR